MNEPVTHAVMLSLFLLALIKLIQDRLNNLEDARVRRCQKCPPKDAHADLPADIASYNRRSLNSRMASCNEIDS